MAQVSSPWDSSLGSGSAYTAAACFRFVRMQRVQADTRVGWFLISRTAFWMFGRHMRFVFRFEWLTLWPKLTVLPQISHRPFTVSPLELSRLRSGPEARSHGLGWRHGSWASQFKRPGRRASSTSVPVSRTRQARGLPPVDGTSTGGDIMQCEV